MRGDLFRMVIAGIIELGLGFYIATSMAQTFTAAAVEAKFTMPEGAVNITSIADGFLWTPYVFSNWLEGTQAGSVSASWLLWCWL